MDSKPPSPWGRTRRNIRSRMVSGILALIPLGFTFLVLRFLFQTTTGVLDPLASWAVGPLPKAAVTILSLLALLVVIYLVGVLMAHVLGRRLVAFGEKLLSHVPVVRSLYGAARQVITSFSASERHGHSKVVLVEFPRPGIKAIGFVTGAVATADGRTLYRVLLPAAINPTAGALQFVPAEQAEDTDLTVEEAMRLLISGGTLAPDRPRWSGDVPDPHQAGV